jgi:hypothetical protein
LQVPEKTTSLSFIASKGSRGRGGIFENTPIVVCMEGTDKDILKQHITSLLAFKKGNSGKKDTYPVFYQKEPITNDQQMEEVARLYALSFLVIHDKVIDWIPLAFVDGAYSNRDVIKVSEDRFLHGIKKLLWRPESRYSLLHLLNSFEIAFDKMGRRIEIENTVEDHLAVTLENIKYESIEKQSREYQLFLANYLSAHPYLDLQNVDGEEREVNSWGIALHNYDMWEGKEDFKKSFNIPRLLSNIK